MGKKKPARIGDDENANPPIKSKKKDFAIDDDEYWIENELLEETRIHEISVAERQEEKIAVSAGKKKGKKGSQVTASELKRDEDGDKILNGGAGEDDEAPAVAISGKKKFKSKKMSQNLPYASAFDALADEGNNDDAESGRGIVSDVAANENDEPPPAVISGKKKKSKSNKGSQNLFAAVGDQEANDIAVAELGSPETTVFDGVAGENQDLHPVIVAGKKKSKTKKQTQGSFSPSAYDGLGDEENADNVQTKGNQAKNLHGIAGDSQESLPVVISGKKKSKTKKQVQGSFTAAALGARVDEDKNEIAEAEPEGMHHTEELLALSRKEAASKSSKKSGNLFNAAGFDVLTDEDDSDSTETAVKRDTGEKPPAYLIGKKKSPKSSRNNSSLSDISRFYGLEEDADEELASKLENQEEHIISLSGKKKPLRSKKITSFNEAIDEYNPAVSLPGNGSPLSRKSNLDDTGLNHVARQSTDEIEEDDVMISLSGKKKSSKSSKKSSGISDRLISDSAIVKESNLLIEPDIETNERIRETETAHHELNKDVMEISSKQKKVKKKSGRTAREEEDLDKILAELGEAPPIPRPAAPEPSVQEKVHPEPEKAPPQVDLSVSNISVDAEAEAEAEAEVGESAAARKKKKKKEREKEKKAAAAASSAAELTEAKSKGAEKKLPKHVREMQEALARRKEAEEKKKQEEEERLRKEEEERRKAEEAERLLQEAKKRKKEKEKEKLLKKKQEGRLLTGKQKEEARRLEAVRNQFFAQSAALPSLDTVTRKPRYERKKSKPTASQANDELATKDVVMETTTQEGILPYAEKLIEADNAAEDSDRIEGEDKAEQAEESRGEEEDEDEDEWDAKSWDDNEVLLPIKSAFDDEEDEEKEKPVIKKAGVRKLVNPGQSISLPVSTCDPDNLVEAPKKNTLPLVPNNQVDVGKRDELKPARDLLQSRKDDIEKSVVQPTHFLPNTSNLRSPICCILGHVDTGKTKLLDCIRGTNVQEGEAGGITQQIGATYFPAENIRERTKELKADAKLLVPGLLVIDTPGHESFTNLRSRGSGLCDIAILVVDIMHGLEPQTIESLNLLKKRETEFIVALNKVDRLYGWKTYRNSPIRKAIEQQSADVSNEFRVRLRQIITQFMEQGLNTELYYKNKHMGEQTYSIVPTSAITGEGIPDLLLLLVQWSQRTMEKKLTFSNQIQCTVLEVKVIEGLGTTIDVVLINGVLHEGDQIVICGMLGPIVTTIRALLTPHPMKELRVKGSYQHHKEIKAAQGVKLSAQGLEQAVAGTELYVVGPDDNLEDVKDVAMEDMKSVTSSIDKSGEGVCVQASTIGSLEALLEFLKGPVVGIPVSGISIGPVHKKDVMRASVMLERKKEYAVILAFDVKVTPEARELADEMGVKIFCADIIYHLFDQFKAYINNLKEEKKKEAAEEAVFPCVLKIMPNCIFNKKDPIVLGVDVLEGLAKVGTPLCIPSRDYIDIGRVASVEINHKQVDAAKKGQKVAIKIVGSNPEEQQKMYGRHFEIDDELVSHVTRRSIDVLKANYREDLSIDEWKLVVKLKNLFKIQ